MWHQMRHQMRHQTGGVREEKIVPNPCCQVTLPHTYTHQMGILPLSMRHQRVTNAAPNFGSDVANLLNRERGTNPLPCHTTGVEMTESPTALRKVFSRPEVSPRNRMAR